MDKVYTIARYTIGCMTIRVIETIDEGRGDCVDRSFVTSAELKSGGTMDDYHQSLIEAVEFAAEIAKHSVNCWQVAGAIAKQAEAFYLGRGAGV